MVYKSALIKDVYKPGDVAKMLGVNPMTVIKYDRKGDIAFTRTGTDRRQVAREELIRYLKEKDLLVDDMKDTRHDIIYARVSTHKQSERGDLDRQVNALKAYAADKSPVNLLVFSEVGSGLNDNRKQLLKLINLVLDGKVSRIFIAYKDRLTRFGFNYLKAAADYKHTEIIIVSDEITAKTVQEELAEDLISIIHSFSGRLYGMRRKALSNLDANMAALKSKLEVMEDEAG